MPIQINLLAEQQAAEEARRRDPVKRAILAGVGLVCLMVLWAVLLGLEFASAKAELTHYEARLQAVEDNSKETRLKWSTASDIESRIANLERYSTNRFFCATILDAMQQVMVDDVRVMELQTAHSYATNSDATFKTNFAFTIDTKKPWQFWKSVSPAPNILTQVSNQLATITNKVESLKTAVPLLTKIDLTTNGNQVTANVEIKKPLSASEQITLTIKARDYGNPLGKRVDDFWKGIANHPYFAQNLRPGEGEGIRLRERAIQAEVDPTDSVNPSKPFIPFTIECRYRGATRANE
jgi:hypothetical protein